VVIPIRRTVKKSLGVLIRLTTSQTQSRTTKPIPMIDVALGRRSASAVSHEGVWVGAAIGRF
jgi:hypothetical protein